MDIIELIVSIEDLTELMAAIVAGLASMWGIRKVIVILKKS
jgi:hypothetical protein